MAETHDEVKMTTPTKKSAKKKEPSKMGAPTKYKPEFCQLAIDMLSEGFSLYAVAAECNVSLQTILNWQDEHQDFFESIKIGKAKSAIWWEKRAQEFSLTGVGNATAIIFGLKNRAKEMWQDKQEIDMNATHKIALPDFGDLD